MAHRLANRRALVTGSSAGIGLAIARQFASEGAHVWLVGRDEEKLGEVVARLRADGADIEATAVDLLEPEGIERLAAQVEGEWPQLDVLVNNAGMARFTPFADVTPEELEAQVRLNMLVPYLLTQRLLAKLVVARGSVINISSTSAHRLIPGRPASAYAMTKGGLNSLTKALALELGPQGVRVNAIAPGTIKTGLTEKLIASMTDARRMEYERFVTESFALGRLGEPEEVAHLAVHLASDEARWTTGSVFVVDGGLSTN
jgi:NAD(P)-dependent dehydrogenase (short-subunit alcohol dehydrogenase family)